MKGYRYQYFRPLLSAALFRHNLARVQGFSGFGLKVQSMWQFTFVVSSPPPLNCCPETYTLNPQLLEPEVPRFFQDGLGQVRSKAQHPSESKWALIIRIGCWGPLYYNDIKEPPKSL